MPSKLGFGNSRTPMTKKVSYGSAMHYKNPVKKMDPMYNNEPGVQKEDFAQFSKESPMDMYGKSPVKNYKNPQDYKVFNMGNPVRKYKKK